MTNRELTPVPSLNLNLFSTDSRLPQLFALHVLGCGGWANPDIEGLYAFHYRVEEELRKLHAGSFTERMERGEVVAIEVQRASHAGKTLRFYPRSREDLLLMHVALRRGDVTGDVTGNVH